MASKPKSDLSVAAALMGRRGGSISTPAKTKAARENGKLGGRPRKEQLSKKQP